MIGAPESDGLAEGLRLLDDDNDVTPGCQAVPRPFPEEGPAALQDSSAFETRGAGTRVASGGIRESLQKAKSDLDDSDGDDGDGDCDDGVYFILIILMLRRVITSMMTVVVMMIVNDYQ